MDAGRRLIGMLVLFVATPAAAQELEPVSRPDWAFGELGAEIALGAGTLGSLAFWFLPQKESEWGPAEAREESEAWGIAADFSGAWLGSVSGMISGWGLEVSYYNEHHLRDGYLNALRTTIIDGEATSLASGLTFLLKRTTGRCRPRAYHDGKCDGDEYDAFPSGHTAPVAALAGVRLVLALGSTQFVSQRWVAFGVTEAGSIATAAFRVLAGAHSWDDVLGGWILGHATGSLMALAHPLEDVTRASQTEPEPPAPGTMSLGISGRF
jgi:membrane-associated phospholipid phosphatase